MKTYNCNKVNNIENDYSVPLFTRRALLSINKKQSVQKASDFKLKSLTLISRYTFIYIFFYNLQNRIQSFDLSPKYLLHYNLRDLKNTKPVRLYL